MLDDPGLHDRKRLMTPEALRQTIREALVLQYDWPGTGDRSEWEHSLDARVSAIASCIENSPHK